MVAEAEAECMGVMAEVGTSECEEGMAEEDEEEVSECCC